jgi:hypothetical protein
VLAVLVQVRGVAVLLGPLLLLLLLRGCWRLLPGHCCCGPGRRVGRVGGVGWLGRVLEGLGSGQALQGSDLGRGEGAEGASAAWVGERGGHWLGCAQRRELLRGDACPRREVLLLQQGLLQRLLLVVRREPCLRHALRRCRTSGGSGALLLLLLLLRVPPWIAHRGCIRS